MRIILDVDKEQNFIDLWNPEKNKWERYIKCEEKDKKIEHYYFSVFQDERLGGRQVVESLESKINEIIDKINRMEEK